MVKNPPANAGEVRDVSSIPGSGGSPEEGMATHSSVLAWIIPWTEESGGFLGVGHENTCTFILRYMFKSFDYFLGCLPFLTNL